MTKKIIFFQDLLIDSEFREYVFRRMTDWTGTPYVIPETLPKLYRYKPLSEYAVDDIVNGKITATSIGEFNDIFDGAIHRYGTTEERENAAEKKWQEFDELRKAAHLPETIINKEDYIRPLIDHYKTESRLKFRELDYLKTFVSCFSEDNASTLMWSHYADSNKGICIEYDFNQLPSDDLVRQSIFPIVYTDSPIDIGDLLDDKKCTLSKYPLDTAVLCSALNKSLVWSYEKEWRFVWVWTIAEESERFLPIKPGISPSRIILGYHFLKPFFYYNRKEKSDCKSKLQWFFVLLVWLLRERIPISIMTPVIGSYSFASVDISVDDLNGFMIKHFRDAEPENMRFYYTVHDQLMDICNM